MTLSIPNAISNKLPATKPAPIGSHCFDHHPDEGEALETQSYFKVLRTFNYARGASWALLGTTLCFEQSARKGDACLHIDLTP